MFYSLLKLYARLAIRIYCVRIRINQPGRLKEKGPLLLASNHPNSFLDGMIMTTLFDAPVYALARGDAFKNQWVNRLLRRIQLLPVYRTSEGVENLGHNYSTFDACRETFQKKGVVLIFSEGGCENEWHLRPLRKGTARLAVTSWEKQIPLRVVPVGMNYSSFQRFGKEVHIYFGPEIEPGPVLAAANEGKKLLQFNSQLEQNLHEAVYEIPPGNQHLRRQLFSIRLRPSFIWLLLPALAGWILHAPLFYLCKLFAHRFHDSGHYDSVLTALLLVLYPVYLLVCMVAAWVFFSWWALLLLILMPLLARAATEVKYQLDL